MVTSNQSAHTPGPWSVGHTRPVKWGFKNEYTHWSVPVHVGPFETRGNSLADVHSGGPGALQPSDREAVEANARLIAAAPELLDALKRIDTELENGPDEDAAQCDHSVGICFCAYRRVRDQMRAAIAKAIGATA